MSFRLIPSIFLLSHLFLRSFSTGHDEDDGDGPDREIKKEESSSDDLCPYREFVDMTKKENERPQREQKMEDDNDHECAEIYSDECPGVHISF